MPIQNGHDINLKSKRLQRATAVYQAMVLLTLSKKITGLIGPLLMRTGLSARQAFLRGQVRDSHYLDMLFLVRYAQKLISLEVNDESARVVTKFKKQTKVDHIVDTAFDRMFGTNVDEERMKKASIAELRVEVLEDNLRPALINNEVWSDVMKWRLNFRVIKWARQEFLISKYGPEVKEALDAYPQLRASPQLARHPTRRMLMNLMKGKPVDLTNGRKTVLPSSETLIKAFGMRDWAIKKDTPAVRKSMVPIAEKLGGRVLESRGTLLNYADIPLEAELYDITVEELLEVTGGHVTHCGPFNAVCEEAEIFQMWTEDFVSHLCKYLMDRAVSFNGETVVLDVGAGDGLLVRFLDEMLEREARRVSRTPGKKRSQKLPTLLAADDGSWGIFAKAQVESLNMTDSILKYKTGEEDKKRQLIVLCSWMPMGEDWTAFFREHGIDEYILIGEADDGTCGHNWETWGNPDFLPHEDDHEIDSEGAPVTNATKLLVPPYKQDGYERWDMETLSQFQFSRFDCAASRSSKTVSFRKKRR